MGIRDVFRENLLLEVYDPRDDIYFKSIIQEVHDDYIAIGIPLRKQKQLYMAKNSTWDFRLTRKDALYYFRSSCIGQKKGDRVSLYLINWPDEVRRVQRREYYRCPCSFDAHYWILKKPRDEEEQPPLTQPEPVAGGDGKEAPVPEGERIPLAKLSEQMGDPGTAMIADISGGGLQLVAPQWLPIGTILLVGIFLQSKKIKKTLFVKGKVIRVSPYQPERTVHFRPSVEYVDTPERIREEIVGFIFVLMRERMVCGGGNSFLLTNSMNDAKITLACEIKK
ncbi:MAG: hypothetical protein C4554_05640 [Dethiobacter sp.]|jgi:c-di-GMP-binding flagellar brake protein YcgR|nr:MAG: hypothetical protein C4554_05640 [Dethiobacter sp.]